MNDGTQISEAERPIFGPWASLFVGHSPLRGCSLLTPRPRPKSLAAPSALIYEMASTRGARFSQAIIFHAFSTFEFGLREEFFVTFVTFCEESDPWPSCPIRGRKNQ